VRIIERRRLSSKDLGLSGGFVSGKEVPEALRRSVDQVVEHLVALRGGAPFLSGADGALLVNWLENDVPASLIVVAIERVAERRRKRRVKSRLVLGSCKAEVKRLLRKGLPGGGAAPEPVPADQADQGGALAALERQALAALEALPEGLPAQRADVAMDIVRRFHVQAWDAAAEEHEQLLAAAEEELAGLRSGMSQRRWREALEEVARDLLRQRFPQLSAVAVWDRLHA